MAVEELEHGRFYTKSRKFKKVIGRFHDGTKIPGGPYTMTQFVVAAAVLVVLNLTGGLWNLGNIFIDWPITGLTTWALAWGAGKLPATKRNPAMVALDAGRAVIAPAMGRYRGMVVTIAKPHTAAALKKTSNRPNRAVARPIPAPVPPGPELTSPGLTTPEPISEPTSTDGRAPVVAGHLKISSRALARLKDQTSLKSK